MATTTTTPADAGLEAFYAYTDEMRVEPELAGAGSFTGTVFKLKQTKDATVGIIDDGNGGKTIGTIENIVTAVKPTFDEGAYMYSNQYADLKKELQLLADEVKKNGSVLKGGVVVNVSESTRDKFPTWLYVTVENDKVVTKEARLGLPDGTQIPFPGTA